MDRIHKISEDSIQAVISSQKSNLSINTRQEKIMGGTGTITVVGDTEKLLDELWLILHRCEQLWSRFLPQSEITQLNQAEGSFVSVSSYTRRLLEEMVKGQRLTEGFFDPTLLPDVVKMGYSSSAVTSSVAPPLPPSAQSPGNLAGITFFTEGVQLPLGTVLDPGGIGKGLAADIASEYGMAQGAAGIMVEVGGDIVVRGTAPDGVSWKLGIENPFESRKHMGVIRMDAGAVATSSQRKRRFGNKHHLINASTRSSADTSVQTVTVLAASAAQAEVLTKRGFTQEPADYLTWITQRGAEAMLVMQDGTQLVSTNWNKYQ